MRKTSNEYVDLVVRTLPSGQVATVRLDEEAAEMFGWTRHYDRLKDHLVELHGGSGFAYFSRSRSRRRQGSGRKFKVVINLPPGSGQKTKTVGVEMGSRMTKFDIAELAHFIECDWHFLIGPDGARKPRDWWEVHYQKGPPAKQETPEDRRLRSRANRSDTGVLITPDRELYSQCG